jgi:hypothetical protein
MDSLLENARRIFEVAQSAGDDDNQDFALLIGPEGALHFVMESPFSMEAAAVHTGAQIGYRITRTRAGVRVEGRSADEDCVLEQRSARRELLRDQALYRITSPLLTSSATRS